MEFQQSESIAKISAALAKAQAEMDRLAKDGKNPHFRSTYATLAATREVAIPVLALHGIAVIQSPGGDGQTITITTQLVHESGEWVRGTLALKAAKADPQGAGSAITYGRRYSLQAMVGLAPEGDDGQAASQPRHGAAKPPARQQPTESLEHKIARLHTTLEDVRANPGDWPNGRWGELVDELVRMSQGDRKPLGKIYNEAKEARDAHVALLQGAA